MNLNELDELLSKKIIDNDKLFFRQVQKMSYNRSWQKNEHYDIDVEVNR